MIVCFLYNLIMDFMLTIMMFELLDTQWIFIHFLSHILKVGIVYCVTLDSCNFLKSYITNNMTKCAYSIRTLLVKWCVFYRCEWSYNRRNLEKNPCVDVFASHCLIKWILSIHINICTLSGTLNPIIFILHMAKSFDELED